jgi:sugar lactone lactonase YvrE
MAYRANAATDAVYDLGEGVIWDAAADRVRWVDIRRGRVHSGRLDGLRIVDIDVLEVGQTVGAVAPAVDGGLLLAAARGLAVVSRTGEMSFGPQLIGRGRLNDGAVDPQGRFVVGSLSDEQDEVLVRVSADGTTETLRTGIRLSNGIGFSPDGGTIYHVDTYAQNIARHPYGPGAFDSSEPWQIIVGAQTPDGLAVDSSGTLWVAQNGWSSVRPYLPSGWEFDEITIDAAQATCPAFVGPGLDILAITSAQEDLDHWTDQSGAIFLAPMPPGITGQPVPLWAGSTTTPYWSIP